MRYRLSLILTIIALLLWSYTFIHAKLDIDSYGLISSLPITFFISLALLTVASAMLWVSRGSYVPLLMLQLLLLIIALYFTPYLLQGTPRFPAAYQNFGFVEYSLRTGQIDPKVVWYHSWPGFPLLFTSFFQVTGIDDPLLTMALFPTIMQILFLLPLFLLLRSALRSGDNRWWVAAWIFSIANWTSQGYFSPQAMAYLLLLYVLALVFKNWKAGMKEASYSVMLILILASLTITHLVTAIMGLLMIAGLYLVWRRRDFNLITIFGVMIGAWMIYGSIVMFKMWLPPFVAEAFRIDIFLFTTYIFRFAETSPEHAFVNYLRVIFTAIFLLLALLGALFPPEEKRLSQINLSFMAIASAPIVMLPAFILGGEFLIRSYLMLLVPVAYFGSKLVGRKSLTLLLTIILIICLPLHIIAHYGNMRGGDYIPPAELRFSDFFFDKTSQGSFLGLEPPLNFKGLGQYRFEHLYAHIPDPERPNRLLAIKEKPKGVAIQYVSLTRRLNDTYRFVAGQPHKVPEIKAWINNSPHYNLVYTNPEVDFYIWQTRL
jgi:hypothetical protein